MNNLKNIIKRILLNIKNNKIILFITIIILIVGLFFLIYVGKIFYIKNYGLHIKPTSSIKPIQIEYYLQNDNIWSKEKLGKTNYTIGSHGCLLSVIASINSHLYQTTNPKELNDIFIDKDIYDNSGEIIWYKISNALPPLNYSYKRIFSGKTISNNLQENIMSIVKVKYKKHGIFHWVLIVGSTDNDFLIYDPLNADKKYTELYKTHGKVYAYREIHSIK